MDNSAQIVASQTQPLLMLSGWLSALRFLMYVTIPVLATIMIFKSGLMAALRKSI